MGVTAKWWGGYFHVPNSDSRWSKLLSKIAGTSHYQNITRRKLSVSAVE